MWLTASSQIILIVNLIAIKINYQFTGFGKQLLRRYCEIICKPYDISTVVICTLSDALTFFPKLSKCGFIVPTQNN